MADNDARASRAGEDSPESPKFLELVTDGCEPGRVLIGVRDFDSAFLLMVSLAQGLGSSELRLDRGRAGKVRLAEFRRVGNRVLFLVRNKHVRTSGDPAAVRAGAESFAPSVVWSGPVLREHDGVVVVDVTGLVVTDHDRIAEQLREHGQGDYVLDSSTSLPLTADSRTGPRGVRLPALLTFRGPGQGAAVREAAADPAVLTFVQQLQLMRLPDPPLPPRRYHPASGGYGIGYTDHRLAGTADTQVKVQPRFRLERTGADPARVRRPIVFQVDPAVPEPFHSAVVEGGNWWQDAFARIGQADAYRVEVGGADFDPYDPDVNAVVWVHRAGRGWSHGQALTDPRTGEILTARVRLGSQRLDQVRALGEALLAPYGHPEEAERVAAVEELVLARVRQLAAHEIGHALGFMHNFASTRHPRPSVMDYPHPHIGVTAEGRLDLSAAYGTGLGPWDHFLVAHAYGEFPGRDEEDALAALRAEAAAAGLVYVTDEDGRGPEAGHPDGVPWVMPGAGDALDALAACLRVRRVALAGFSPGVLPPDRQTGELEERIVLLHLLHRHEVAAAARLIGGVRYAYGRAGENGGGTVAVDAMLQRRAVSALTELLRAEELALPDRALAVLTPPGIRYGRTSQYFDTLAGRVFDPFAAARTAAAMVTEQLLEPGRLNRLAWQHAVDPAVPGVTELLDATLAATWRRTDPVPSGVTAGAAVQYTAGWLLLHHLLTVLGGTGLHAPVRAEVLAVVRRLAADLRRPAGPGQEGAQEYEAAELLSAYLADPDAVRVEPLPRIPPGAPN
ncbi:zinc-dependent metalloprotease [Streptomyces sp. KM273126]|uniref:zinc-dependent metalloprotease n=1 Tax=Streptomyces sp. KM273126 TaxID=2545247 RepID=UPI00103AA24B|nr:zinc-dependent metalloprotease [Streptomyces sp. KM273126]MBA2813101.1 zinc-dependent metalloprotease [Streptomyces sp. KM273126]